MSVCNERARDNGDVTMPAKRATVDLQKVAVFALASSPAAETWNPRPPDRHTHSQNTHKATETRARAGAWDTYESVASTLARLPICDDDGLFDLAVDFKMFPQRLVGRVVGQAADKDLCEGCVLLRDAGRVGQSRAACRRKGRRQRVGTSSRHQHHFLITNTDRKTRERTAGRARRAVGRRRAGGRAAGRVRDDWTSAGDCAAPRVTRFAQLAGGGLRMRGWVPGAHVQRRGEGGGAEQVRRATRGGKPLGDSPGRAGAREGMGEGRMVPWSALHLHVCIWVGAVAMLQNDWHKVTRASSRSFDWGGGRIHGQLGIQTHLPQKLSFSSDFGHFIFKMLEDTKI